ncbi:MAG: xanthine dehydrogenase molybdopterin binding subunit, partial [Pseudomonadota bacterium]
MSVAKPLPHDAAALHVTGAARYVDDIPTPRDTLHLAFGISDQAAGDLKAMDLANVRNAPGIVAVLIADDLPYANDVSPSAHDEPLLAENHVHYLGQPLFLVIAESHLAARHAARMGDVEIKAAKPLLTIEEALAVDSRFEEGPRIWARGDAASALAAAPHRLTGRIALGGQEHFYLEGQAALCLPQENGDMVVMSSTQHPTEIQHKVADALGMPMNAVRVETRRMGGGFGGKESQGNALAVACAIAAAKTGKPCKMRYDRDDDMIITGKRHDFRIDYDVGFDAQGRIHGIDMAHYTRCGWALDLSLPVADRAMLHADNAYFLPAVRITSHRLKTNTQSATAFRGFGGPQGMAGIERIMDHIAQFLGVEPLTVRRANFYASPNHNVTPYGQTVEDFILPKMIDHLCKQADYVQRCKGVTDWNASNDLVKKGIALTPVKFGISFTLTHLNQAGALVHVYQDGSIHMNHGGTEMGQGLFQKVAQVAASGFGVSADMVKITATDTGKVPNTSATAASSGSDLNGMAVKVACDTIRDRMAEMLAEKHQTSASDVTFREGRVFVAGEDYGFAEVAQMAYMARVSLSATGFYKTPKLAWDRIKGQGRPFFYFAYGA